MEPQWITLPPDVEVSPWKVGPALPAEDLWVSPTTILTLYVRLPGSGWQPVEAVRDPHTVHRQPGPGERIPAGQHALLAEIVLGRLADDLKVQVELGTPV